MRLSNLLFTGGLAASSFAFLLVDSMKWMSGVDDDKLYVLAISNSKYASSDFATYGDITYSTKLFADVFDKVAKKVILDSSGVAPLSKAAILSSIGMFVKQVESYKLKKRKVGVIYYCGHGLANLSGTVYLVPGDASSQLEHKSFSDLSSALIPIDEIISIVNSNQRDGGSTYLILADCCTDKVASDVYDGIGFKFKDLGAAEMNFDLSQKQARDFLQRQAEITFDDISKDLPKVEERSTKPTETSALDATNFISENIRLQTFISSGNKILYSSTIGSKSAMVEDPIGNSRNAKIAQICRRTVMYFGAIERRSRFNLREYLDALTSEKFDTLTRAFELNQIRK